MNAIKMILGKGGRINIPAEYRRALGLVDGDEVLVGMEEGAIRIQTRKASLERARRLVRPYVGGGRPSMSEELLLERRAEAERE
jgi:AbrB family looped-hinge helix DNA binding protein